ncbi:MAG: hypothetical protein ACQGVK_19345 [Myxococcota bacterium]
MRGQTSPIESTARPALRLDPEHPSLPGGEIRERRVPGSPAPVCDLYVPSRIRRGAPRLVLVHGISRNAREHVEAFAPFAEERGWLLIAPRFDPTTYGDYQRLGRCGRGARADRALDQLLLDVASEYPETDDRLALFGFSGGGQFAHRYLMAQPDRVAAAVVAAAGWYTFPDPARRYPYGLRTGRSLPGVRFVPTRFRRVPTRVVVGSEDTARDPSLRQSASLDATQGRNRVERARRWVKAMNGLASPGPDLELRLLAGVGHDFGANLEAGLVGQAVSFLEPYMVPAHRTVALDARPGPKS